MKLISMTDFVLEQEKNPMQTFAEAYRKCRAYAEFLKQPLMLGMFVPCDEERNVLEEPKDYDLGLKFPYSNKHSEECEKYQQAKEWVLFEFDGDLTLIRNVTNFYIIEDKNGVYLRVLKYKTKTTIESLLKFSVEITLTQSALKQIGL